MVWLFLIGAIAAELRALEAAKALAADKVDVAVLHVPTIKPLDEATIRAKMVELRAVARNQIDDEI